MNHLLRRQYIAASILPRLDLRPYIDGSFRNSSSADEFQVTDPFTGMVLAKLAVCNAADVEVAVLSATNAFPSWASLSPCDRSLYLMRIADIIDAERETIALLESIDCGKPLSGTLNWDVPNASQVFRYYAELASEQSDAHLEIAKMDVEIRMCPVGVCAFMVAWNFPFACMAWKCAPALAAGCTVVLKSAERAPLSAQYLASVVERAGLPAGVFNLISGDGQTTGRMLSTSSGVNQISFTGSTQTGMEIQRLCAGGLPRLTFELGGKSAYIVFGDADLEAAADHAIYGMFDVAGQSCCATSRVLIEDACYDSFKEAITVRTVRRKLGDPLADETEQGPLIDRRHFDKVAEYLANALEEGASPVVGGAHLPGNSLLFPPTILENVSERSRLYREEVYGPIASLHRFKGADEAMRMASDTSYGLAASIWTRDSSIGDKLVQQLRVGTCWVNTFGAFDVRVPWGGNLRSGHGRELGKAGLAEFQLEKSVFTSL